MDSLFSLFRRRAKSAAEPASLPAPPAISQTTSLPLRVDRRIHPNLNALAAEFEEAVPQTRRPSGDIPLSTQPRRHSQPGERPVPPTAAPLSPTPLDALHESTVSLSSASTSSHPAGTDTSAHDTTRSSSDTRVLASLAQRNLALTTAPSAWSTFGRRTVRETQSVPHFTDFGESGPSRSQSRPSSIATSHQSHGTSPETPPLVYPTSPMNTVDSGSPGSGFTFGSFGYSATPPPPLPTLDHPAFVRFARDNATETHSSIRQPRPSSSLPYIRPKAQDIFSSPSSQPSPSRRSSIARRRRRRVRSHSIDTDSEREIQNERSRYGQARGGQSFSLVSVSLILCFFSSPSLHILTPPPLYSQALIGLSRWVHHFPCTVPLVGGFIASGTFSD
ncbi:hypothetical protein C8J56DRAFT_456583 [Mycena floridula]|nr:hypothetical protein C8J56DRAFT_456583 [Mycena floridula]